MGDPQETIRSVHSYATDTTLREEEAFNDEWATFKQRLTAPLYKKRGGQKPGVIVKSFGKDTSYMDEKPKLRQKPKPRRLQQVYRHRRLHHPEMQYSRFKDATLKTRQMCKLTGSSCRLAGVAG